MTGINTDWAVSQLDGFITATTLTFVPSPPNSIGFHSYKTAEPEHEVVKRAQIVEQILDRVVPDWRKLEVDTDRKKWAIHHEASVRAKESLLRADEVRKNLGDDAPEISAANLHPWIWSGASSLWQSGHYREAVEGAIKKLNAETQNKVGRRDVSEANLFKEAFSLDDPQFGKARLRRMKDDGSKTYQSVQRGVMSLAEGVFAGIRNPLSHEADQELSEQEALEYLAALSVLARWVDSASVECEVAAS
ncbi:TIGR02391 family protein [Mycolicibacterium austroafricanum]|uniref:TIGR02391 family protein n=1 Tax=Mycolicibacterium austroafricanum TaxID=39687 RepID=A0ABT8HMS8_MYCAO|nr:TIGR02391 family protein [Mycolicibacterium austroafricanum]MDN4522059.1 TIGR02391 family protein [Mycolicibacterium austroafricanum]